MDDALPEVAFHQGTVELRPERDLGWIKDALGDTARSKEDRAMLLEAAMHLAAKSRERAREHVSGLKPLVSDQADPAGKLSMSA